MKKKYFAILALLAVCFLGGCKKDKYTVNTTGMKIEIAEGWLDDMKFSDTTINEYDQNEAHFRFYIPQDITSSVKVNVVNVEDPMSVRFDRLIIPYATGYAFDAVEQSKIAQAYGKYFKENALSFSYSTTVPETWSVEYKPTDEAQSGKYRSLYTVYMPVYVERYKSYSDEIRVDVKAYVLIPIAYGIGYSSTEEINISTIEGIDSAIQSLSSVDFKTTNGLLKAKDEENE